MSPTEYFDVGFFAGFLAVVSDALAVEDFDADDLAEVLVFFVAMDGGSLPARCQSTCGVHS